MITSTLFKYSTRYNDFWAIIPFKKNLNKETINYYLLAFVIYGCSKPISIRPKY